MFLVRGASGEDMDEERERDQRKLSSEMENGQLSSQSFHNTYYFKAALQTVLRYCLKASRPPCVNDEECKCCTECLVKSVTMKFMEKTLKWSLI